MNKNKTTTIILVSIGLIAALGILFFIGRQGAINQRGAVEPQLASSGLVSDEPVYDFGTISMAAGLVRYEFKVRNSGAEPVAIERLYTSCMCTLAYFVQNGSRSGPFGLPGHGFVPRLRQTVAPGEEVTIAVTFDPAAHGPAGLGLTERLIYFESERSKLLTLAIKANVTP